MSFERNNDPYLQVAQNGVERQVYLLGFLPVSDWKLNEQGRFDDDSSEVAGDWNRLMTTYRQGDWWAFVQANGDRLEISVAFAHDADEDAFVASWSGIGA